VRTLKANSGALRQHIYEHQRNWERVKASWLA